MHNKGRLLFAAQNIGVASPMLQNELRVTYLQIT